jgi:hydroxyethylthiazole kinase-like uncharacterized protein yjeF
LNSMKILTAAQIRAIDRLSTEKFGVPGILLMENAGMRVVEALEARFENLEEQSIAILCGKGNNGGDGVVVARQLIQRDCYPTVFLFASPEDVSGDARTNLDILTAIGHPPVVIGSEEEWERERLEIIDANIVIDALLGTGLSKPVDGLLRSVVAGLRDFCPGAMIVSIDLPSGCDADSANLAGPSVEADLTVTLTAPKPCLVLPPAHEMAGEVVIADIGNPRELFEDDGFDVNLLLPDSFPDVAFVRDDVTHKGDYGRVLVIGGSRGKAGAAAMSGRAALQSGAGLVTVAASESAASTVANHMAELMVEPLPEGAAGTISPAALDYGRLSSIIEGKSIVALGPGMGQDQGTIDLVRTLLPRFTVPLILDADGLNAFEGCTGELRDLAFPVILTPHLGEMSRLVGLDVAEIERDRIGVARNFATDHELYVVLKGFRTVIASPDGTVFINPTGNAGMATAGSGDILTGMIAGTLAQSRLGSFEERLCLAVYLHGLAGDLAADEVGEEGLIATDILQFLPEAWNELRGG